MTKSRREMRSCVFNLVFHLRGAELANITDRGTPHFLPLPPPPRKVAIMSNIFISFLTYTYDFNSLDIFLRDPPPYHLIFPLSWSRSHFKMGIPLIATPPSVARENILETLMRQTDFLPRCE